MRSCARIAALKSPLQQCRLRHSRVGSFSEDEAFNGPRVKQLQLISEAAMHQLVREPNDELPRSLLGLDVGDKRVGVAHSDRSFTLAFPGTLLDRSSKGGDVAVSESLRKLVEAERACGLVVGWPIEMSGNQGTQCDKVFHFLHQLDIQLPIVLVDERLSSAVCRDVLHQTRIKREKHKEVIDNMAATYILQGFLDAGD
jgi:putative Holliday junction resolvase